MSADITAGFLNYTEIEIEKKGKKKTTKKTNKKPSTDSKWRREWQRNKLRAKEEQSFLGVQAEWEWKKTQQFCTRVNLLSQDLYPPFCELPPDVALQRVCLNFVPAVWLFIFTYLFI